MGTKRLFELGALSSESPASQRRTTSDSAGSRSRRVAPIAPSLNSLYRELSITKAKLSEVTKDCALLLASNAILKKDVQRIQKFAYHDELTGLPNRRLLEDRYRPAVARSDRQRENVALLFIDIDRFKHVNDTFGHGVADRLLQQLSSRLVQCIRISDTACRYGGDEFVVLLPDCQGTVDAAAKVSRIRNRLSAPFLLGSETVKLSVSIGSALYPTNGMALRELIRAADADMYRQKAYRTFTRCTVHRV